MADGFVLDASVTIRWALLDGSVSDRAYADQVLDSFAVAAQLGRKKLGGELFRGPDCFAVRPG